MEARLKKNSTALQNAIYQMRHYGLLEVPFFFESNQMSAQQLDPSHVSLCHVSFDPKKLFETYQCNEPLTVGMYTWQTNKLFEKLQKDDDEDTATTCLKIAPSQEEKVLSVFLEKKESFQQANLPLYEVKNDVILIIPETDYDAVVTMPTDTFYEVMKFIVGGTRGEGNCTIKVTAEGIYFTAVGKNSVSFTKLLRYNGSVSVTGEPNGNDKVLDIMHLWRMARNSAGPVVTISAKSDDPIKIEYDLGDTTETTGKQEEKVGSLQYYLAPRDDDPELISQPSATLFEACLADSRLLAEVIGSVRDIDGQTKITISAEGIRFVGRSSDSTKFVDVTLHRDLFNEFHFRSRRPTIERGFDISHLRWALEEVSDGGSLAISIGKGDRLYVKCESTSKDEITVHAMNLYYAPSDKLSPDYSDSLLKSTVKIPTLLWQPLLKDLKGDECAVTICSDGILLETNRGTSCCLRSANNPNIAFDVQKPTERRFSLEDLKRLEHVAKFGSTISLSIGTEGPLKMECDFRLSQASSVVLYTSEIFDLTAAVSKAIRKVSNRTHDIGVNVDVLAHRLKTCREAVASHEVTVKAKPSTRKRKRARSASKKPPAARKKAARTKPKLCSVCKEVKVCSEFFPAHLRKTTKASCIDCLVSDYGAKMSDWVDPDSFGTQEASVSTMREEIRRLRSLRLERYECPAFFDYAAANEIGQGLQASFVSTLPGLETLAGEYDVIYEYSGTNFGNYSSPTTMQRATKGTLCIQNNGMRGGGTIGLSGRLAMPAVLVDITEPYVSSFTFAPTEMNGPSNSFEVPIQLTNFTRTPNTSIAAEGHTGTLRMLGKRTATGWNPSESPLSKSVISFDTVEEAQALTKRREEMFIANSWIRNHLGLPTELALMIHEYVAFRPPLAFFFEKGDLWMDLKWKNPDGENTNTIFVARRRSGEK